MSDTSDDGGTGDAVDVTEEQHRESVRRRLAQQWAEIRRIERERHLQPPPIVAGPSNFSRAEVPYGVDLAAAWSWRLLVITGAAVVLGYLVSFFSILVLPLAIALLLAALVAPLVDLLARAGVRRSAGAALTVVATLSTVTGLLTFAGQQVADGAADLADSVNTGIDEVTAWLKNGPLDFSDSQIDRYIERVQEAITAQSSSGGVVSQATEVGTTVGHVLAGFFIVLFATYFFLADGARIWAWLVRLSPRAARERMDTSGRVAWVSLTQFVRATVIVAAVDAVGIMAGAFFLGVPFVLAIGVLVFLGSFVPLIGATVAGAVAVLVALVDQGPITALIMLAVVIGVQQLEAHILQPFLMGRWVSLHPLGVILAIGAGVVTAGVAGALVAVPLAAAVNAVVQHLAAYTDVGDDPVEELKEDFEETGATPKPPPTPQGGDDGVVGG